MICEASLIIQNMYKKDFSRNSIMIVVGYFDFMYCAFLRCMVGGGGLKSRGIKCYVMDEVEIRNKYINGLTT